MTDSLTISTDGLTKRYGDYTAVEALSLGIPRGSIYGFLGPNGAGKTTTIRLLTGLTRPTSGTGHIEGAPITDREAIRPYLGYLPAIPPIHDELTAREQLEYHGGLRDMSPSAIAARTAELLDRFDLAEVADDRISTYSTGMKQKTGLIQALLHDPAVVILDEPTSGLDPGASRTFRETVRELAAEGTTVFLSTHSLREVTDLATEVGILTDGELVTEGQPDDLIERVEGDDPGSLEDAFNASVEGTIAEQ